MKLSRKCSSGAMRRSGVSDLCPGGSVVMSADGHIDLGDGHVELGGAILKLLLAALWFKESFNPLF